MGKFFSEREIRAVAVFLPLAGLFLLGLVLIRSKGGPEAARRAEAAMEMRTDSIRMKAFDPNTADRDELLQLGLSNYEIVSLLKFRESGKIFRIPEDVSLCYGISDSTYRRLAPYIHIGREYRIKPKRHFDERTITRPIAPSPFLIDTVKTAYLRAIGISKGRAAAIIRWRDLSGLHDMEELRECYVVDDSLAAALEPYILFSPRKAHPIDQPVELNGADSATLRSIVGIGEKTVESILLYRERLGGFVRVEQLAEVPGIRENNYEKILKQIYCDSCKIQKIDVNFAPSEELRRHPYITPQKLRKLLKQRQLKGGWSTAEQMIEDHILTREEAARLAPYLRFGVKSGPDNE